MGRRVGRFQAAGVGQSAVLKGPCAVFDGRLLDAQGMVERFQSGRGTAKDADSALLGCYESDSWMLGGVRR